LRLSRIVRRRFAVAGGRLRRHDCPPHDRRSHAGSAVCRRGGKEWAINAVLKDIAGKSAVQEFWITDSSGHAYLNTGIDFTFSSDAKKQPQASVFWPLITGAKKVVIQNARKREIDNKIFKFVGVAGVDKPRIVQVGVSAVNLCK